MYLGSAFQFPVLFKLFFKSEADYIYLMLPDLNYLFVNKNVVLLH